MTIMNTSRTAGVADSLTLNRQIALAPSKEPVYEVDPLNANAEIILLDELGNPVKQYMQRIVTGQRPVYASGQHAYTAAIALPTEDYATFTSSVLLIPVGDCRSVHFYAAANQTTDDFTGLSVEVTVFRVIDDGGEPIDEPLSVANLCGVVTLSDFTAIDWASAPCSSLHTVETLGEANYIGLVVTNMTAVAGTTIYLNAYSC